MVNIVEGEIKIDYAKGRQFQTLEEKFRKILYKEVLPSFVAWATSL